MSPLWHNLVVHFTGWHSRKIQSLNNHIIIRLMFLLLYHVVIFRTMLPQNKCLLFGFILQKTVWVNPDKICFYLLPFCGRMITSMNAIYNNENNGTRLCSSFHHQELQSPRYFFSRRSINLSLILCSCIIYVCPTIFRSFNFHIHDDLGNFRLVQTR